MTCKSPMRASSKPAPGTGRSPSGVRRLRLLHDLTARARRPRGPVTEKAVAKHINGIFTKLDLPLDEDDHRRVRAVLAWLRL